MRKLFLFLIFLDLSSCTTGRVARGVNGEQGQVSPSFVISGQVNESKKIIPSIEESSYISDNSFGPSRKLSFSDEAEKSSSEERVRNPVVGIFFSPGLQRTMVFLDLFKEFKRQQVSVHVLSGTGFGNVMAGLMVSDLSFGRMEWVLFKFWNKSKNYEAYSKKWYGVLEDVVLREFGDLDIQSFGRLVFLPSAFDNGKKVFFKTGKSGDIFKKVFSQNERKKDKSRFIHFDRNVFVKRGVDIIIYANVLGSEITLSKPNSILKKSFEKFAMEKKRSLMFNHHDLYFDFLDEGGSAIDSLVARKKWEKGGQAWARRTAVRVKEAIKLWKEESLKVKGFNDKGQ